MPSLEALEGCKSEQMIVITSKLAQIYSIFMVVCWFVLLLKICFSKDRPRRKQVKSTIVIFGLLTDVFRGTMYFFFEAIVTPEQAIKHNYSIVQTLHLTEPDNLYLTYILSGC